MFGESDPKRSQLLVYGFGIPLCLIFTLGALLYRASVENIQAVDWIKHTYQVADLIEETQGDIVDAETGQRGFLLTGDEKYLEPYNDAVAVIEEEVDHLQVLTADNGIQQANIRDLRRLIATRLDQFKTNIQTRREKGLEAALPIVAKGEGRKTMDEIRRLMNRMKAEEVRLLSIRNTRLQSVSKIRQLLSVAVVIVGVAFIVVVVALMIRLQRMQNLVRVCAWTGRVEFNGKWMSLEEYLQARFGSKITHGMSDEAVKAWQKEVEQLQTKPS